ncbi:hypothetical protein [Marinobacter sp. F4206]|uniref:hypothetical protein n=1 Tax=Marinobacter sp. F4206 TaxID=2861777 RepID=UPI001C603B59|nr:hypothetical protein [Marinobacter sp. F4206]MBW4936130.1 hypothetical protein [Marinobacter sp. F4206]
MDITSVKFLSMAVATVLITGCGGGGGGGSTASSSAQLSLDTQGYGGKKASLRVQGDLEDATTAYSDINGVISLVEDVEVSLQSPSGDTAVATAAAAEPEYSCVNPDGVVDVQQTIGSTSENYVFTLSNCQVQTFNHGVLLLNGEYRLEATASGDGSSGTVAQRIDISGQELDSGADLAILGSQTATIRATSDSNYSITTVSPSMEYRLGNEYVATRNSEFVVSQSVDIYTLSMSTDLVSSALGGYVSFSTPTPIEVVLTEDCPIRGHVLLEGDGTVEARYGQSTGRGFGLEVLVNGSEVSYEDTCVAALPL